MAGARRAPDGASILRLGAILSLAVPLLAACQVASSVDERLRRIDALDRIFGPEPLPPAPPVAPPPVEAPPAAVVVPVAEPGPWFEPVGPAPEPAPSPAPDPALRTQFLLRQEPWLSSFWSGLTPPQQQRVERSLRRTEAGRQATGEGFPALWDGMGLSDRVILVFGPGGR